jgi:hypothetical protein
LYDHRQTNPVNSSKGPPQQGSNRTWGLVHNFGDRLDTQVSDHSEHNRVALVIGQELKLPCQDELTQAPAEIRSRHESLELSVVVAGRTRVGVGQCS